MTTRPEVLQEFIDSVADAILSSVACDGLARASAERTFAALERPGLIVAPEPRRLPVCSQLEPALGVARRTGGAVRGVADALERLEPSLIWGSRAAGPGASDDFPTGHANAWIVGSPTGLERRADVAIGVSLLAPGVRYPDHHHHPEEVYYVLAPGSWRHGDGDWFDREPGGIVYNEPDILHAMRSNQTPLLAVWCLHADQPSRPR